MCDAFSQGNPIPSHTSARLLKVSRVSNRISTYQAWQRLLDGNERFVTGDSLHANQNASVLHVPLIVVLGHDNCGAVTATKDAVETGEVPQGHIRDLVERITPFVLKVDA